MLNVILIVVSFFLLQYSKKIAESNLKLSNLCFFLGITLILNSIGTYLSYFEGDTIETFKRIVGIVFVMFFYFTLLIPVFETKRSYLLIVNKIFKSKKQIKS